MLQFMRQFAQDYPLSTFIWVCVTIVALTQIVRSIKKPSVMVFMLLSLFLAGNSYATNPTVTVDVNGVPSLTENNSLVTATVSINPGSYAGVEFAAYASMWITNSTEDAWFYLSSTGQWIPYAPWDQQAYPAIQGPLETLNNIEFFSGYLLHGYTRFYVGLVNLKTGAEYAGNLQPPATVYNIGTPTPSICYIIDKSFNVTTCIP
jgi:hypothetical protein